MPADRTRAALLQQWDELVRSVDPLPDAVFDAPTRLPGWTGGVLVAHLTNGPRSVVRALSDPRPTGLIPSILRSPWSVSLPITR